MMKQLALFFMICIVTLAYGSEFRIYSEIVQSVGESLITQYNAGHTNLETVEQDQFVAVHFFISDIADFDGFEGELVFPSNYLEYNSYEPNTNNINNVFTVPVYIEHVNKDTVALALTSGGIEVNAISVGEYAYLGAVYFKALQNQPRGILLSGLSFVDNSAALYTFTTADTSTSFGGGPLPVELSSFVGAWQDGGIRLDWQTESEYNALGFHLLRSQHETNGYEQITSRIINTVPDSRFPHRYSFFDKNVLANVNYFYKIIQVDKGGQTTQYGPIQIMAQATFTADNFQLYQNYPNPFNSRTIIRYSLSQDERVSLNILNMNGQVVKTLKSGFSHAGEYKNVWDGTDNSGVLVTSGIYWCRLESETKIINKKIAYLK